MHHGFGTVLATPTQSDKSLHNLVDNMLRGTGYAVLQRIQCHVKDGMVRLSGDVPSFYFKQIAQEVLLTSKHVQGVHNDLNVQCSP